MENYTLPTACVFDKPVPRSWLDVLERVRLVFPRAILAGGCLRDLAMRGEVKDLDIFVPQEAIDGEAVDFSTKARDLGWVADAYAGNIANYATAFRREVVYLESYKAPWCVVPVQIIHLDLPSFSMESVVSRMDFGACQIATDGTMTYISHAALKDIAGRKITLVRCEDAVQAKRSLKRAARFRERYPNVGMDLSISAPFIMGEQA